MFFSLFFLIRQRNYFFFRCENMYILYNEELALSSSSWISYSCSLAPLCSSRARQQIENRRKHTGQDEDSLKHRGKRKNKSPNVSREGNNSSPPTSRLMHSKSLSNGYLPAVCIAQHDVLLLGISFLVTLGELTEVVSIGQVEFLPSFFHTLSVLTGGSRMGKNNNKM